MTPSQALDLLRQYPFDISPAIIALNETADLDDPAIEPLCERIAAAMPSTTALEDLLGDRAALMANFYPAEKLPNPDTIDTIDTFLSTFGTQNPTETEALEKLIFSPVPDYAATLAAEERNSSLPTTEPAASENDRLIDTFIRSSRQAPAASSKPVAEKTQSDKSTNIPADPAPQPRQPEAASLTDSFVRMLIKNRNYAKALEIISENNLKNPKKNIYFADQMRFLKKLIINENKK